MKLIIDPVEWFRIDQTETTNTYKNDFGTVLFEDCDEFNCTYSYWDITDKNRPIYLGSTEPCQIDTGINGSSQFVIEFYGLGNNKSLPNVYNKINKSDS